MVLKLFQIIKTDIFHVVRRNCAQNVNNVVKVVSESDKDYFNVSFMFHGEFYDRKPMHVIVKKDEELQGLLSKIKSNLSILSQAYNACQKYLGNNVEKQNDSETQSRYDVSVVKNVNGSFRIIDSATKNIDALTPDSLLKINETVYNINIVTSKIVKIRLPDYILVGSSIQPRVKTVFGSHLDFNFTWYRSFKELSNYISETSGKSEIVKDENNCLWMKVGEGFTYVPTENDIGHQLRVEAYLKSSLPTYGSVLSAYSKYEVEAAPDSFPFEERHVYTKDFVNDEGFRCVSYNILANMYAKKRDSYVDCSPKGKNIGYRMQLVLRELLGYKSDIICLQEVEEDDFKFSLVPVLTNVGYDGFFCMKGTTVGISCHDSGKKNTVRHMKDGGLDGLACFFRTSKFRVVKKHNMLLNRIKTKKTFKELVDKMQECRNLYKVRSQDTILQIVLLEHIANPDQRILVANTHLYSHKDYPEARLIQSAVSAYYLEHLLEEENENPNSATTATIFCGDFNSLPESSAFKFITTGRFDCPSSWENGDIQLDSDSSLNHHLDFDSAYGTPAYTNYTKEFQGCLDYIFYSKKYLDVSEVVPMPSHEAVAKEALPSELFPSDHLALVCTLNWKNRITWKKKFKE